MDLIIFDCDGILVDSEPMAIQANIETLAEFGYHASQDEIIKRFVGRSLRSIISVVQEWIGEENSLQWRESFQQRYYARLEAEVEAVDGVIEALDQITALSCVASSGTLPKMQMTLGRVGLYPRFEGRIFSASEVVNGKPAPDLFLHAAQRMGVPAQRCVVIEDSRYGVEAARAAGMRSFGYTGGVTPAAWLEGPGTVLFDDMRKLPSLLMSTEQWTPLSAS